MHLLGTRISTGNFEKATHRIVVPATLCGAKATMGFAVFLDPRIVTVAFFVTLSVRSIVRVVPRKAVATLRVQNSLSIDKATFGHGQSGADWRRRRSRWRKVTASMLASLEKEVTTDVTGLVPRGAEVK